MVVERRLPFFSTEKVGCVKLQEGYILIGLVNRFLTSPKAREKVQQKFPGSAFEEWGAWGAERWKFHQGSATP